VRDASNSVHSWQQQGIRCIVLDLGIDLATPAGRMFFHQLSAFAEFEREMIGQRIREIKRYLASQKRPYGNRPFGWVRDRKGAGARFVECPQEREVAKRADSLLGSGMSLRQAWNVFYQEKIAKPGRRFDERTRGALYRLDDIALLAMAYRLGFPIVPRDSLRAYERQHWQPAG
jgi:DNA invertase Pin-like site-specific DNA recombinase